MVFSGLSELAEMYEREKLEEQKKKAKHKRDIKKQTMEMLSELNQVFAAERQKEEESQKQILESISLSKVLRAIDEATSTRNIVPTTRDIVPVATQTVEIENQTEPLESAQIEIESGVEDVLDDPEVDSDVAEVLEALGKTVDSNRRKTQITGLSYLGEWSVLTQYDPGNIVYYDMSSWIAVKETRGDVPNLQSKAWQIFASKGRDGKTVSPGSGVGPQEATQIANAVTNAVTGAGCRNVTSVSENYTTTVTDNFIAVDASAGDTTITITQLAVQEKEYIIKKVDSSTNRVIIATENDDKIDGADTAEITEQYTSLSFVYTGTEWFIV